MICSRRECKCAATHYIGFRAWAIGQDKTTSKAFTGTISLTLCKPHAAEAAASPDILMTEQNWMQIEFAMACHSRQKADKASVELRPVKGKPPRQAYIAKRRASG